MANATSKHTRVLIFIILISSLFFISEARLLYQNEVPNVHENFDAQLFLLKLGYDAVTLEKYGRRSLVVDRVAPGGPNGQHHSLPPSSS